MNRTDQDKVMMAPIELQLGVEKYKVRPLRCLEAQEWRTKLNTEMAPISEDFQKSNGEVSQTLAKALLTFPEKVRDLVFAYAKELDRQSIEPDATDEQFAQAFNEIMVVAYPYLASVLMVTKVIRPTSSL